MNRILQKMGFHKTDEMERYIIFKAQRNSYIFLMIALLIWSLYESSKVYISQQTESAAGFSAYGGGSDTGSFPAYNDQKCGKG